MVKKSEYPIKKLTLIKEFPFSFKDVLLSLLFADGGATPE